MFQVIDVINDARNIAGHCDQSLLFDWLSDAVALIANKGQFDPYLGFLDLCVSVGKGGDYYVTLPREVGAILGVTICGRPALARNELFSFHLNGPGEERRAINWAWDDRGLVCTMKDLRAPRKLVATVENPADCEARFVVHGFTAAGAPVRQERGGSWQDGWQVPLVYGYPVAGEGAPEFARITRVSKSITHGMVYLWAIDADASAGLIGQYEPDETEPVYRRIRLSRAADWVRVAYRKTNPRIRSLYERIPLRSRLALLLALKAVKAYAENNLPEAQGFEANAARLETEAQIAFENPGFGPIQVVEVGNSISDRRDLQID